MSKSPRQEAGKAVDRFQLLTDEERMAAKEEGRKEVANNIAQRMLVANFEIAQISDMTGLSIDEVKKLKM